MTAGIRPTTYLVSNGNGLHPVDGAVIEETTVRLNVNGRELAAFMCSPVELEALALGFLRSEAIIEEMDEIATLVCSPSCAAVDIWLHHDLPPIAQPIRTSGCGGGLTYDDLTQTRSPLPAGICVTTQTIIDRYYDMRAAERLYPAARGVHTSGLCTADQLLIIGEDVGRHNTIDKLWGEAMRRDIDPTGGIIVTTGRISSEMLGKAAKMGVPIVASRTSPTSRALDLAQAWNITVIGYIRRNSLRVYTAPERVTNNK